MAGPVHVHVGVVCMHEANRRVHGVAFKSNMGGYFFTNSMLVDMYLKCSSLEDAHRAFTVKPERNFAMWATVIFVHNEHRHIVEALTLFNRMREDGCMPNDV
jgi:pentatricopeptide repeat protein